MEILLNWMPLDALRLLERGGMILLLIMLLSLMMWSLIIYLYLQLWSRNGAQVSDRCMPLLPLIISLVQILPMVGLLGTIEAMIELFHVIAQHGSGNIRGMAGGISQALITTMAGLVASLSGYYFSSDLQHRLSYPTTPQESL